MTTKELNDTLREQGRFLGMCDEFYDEKWNYSLEQLVERMFKGIDFCLKHHWPSNEFIAKNFPKDFLREHGVFLDDEYSTCNVRESLVLGNSKVKFRYSGKYYGNIRVRDLSLADITFDNNYSAESNEESELGNIIKNLPSISSDIDNI